MKTVFQVLESGVGYHEVVVLPRAEPTGEDQARETAHVLNRVYDVDAAEYCMTKSIRNFALLALVAIAFSYASATDHGMPADPQDVAAGKSVDSSKQGSVSILAEYACKHGTHHKAEREGLVSVVMQRGADDQPARVFGAKDSKTGEVAFIHVLDSDCSQPPVVAQGAASLVLVHKASGEQYFYAISGQGECLRAFRLKFLGQFVPVDMSTTMQDCQNEVRIWSAQATKWKSQAKSADNTKP